MNYIFVGLGNPGKEYEKTRHNTGRIILNFFINENNFPEVQFDKKLNALTTTGKIGKEKITIIFPETFMNNSGKCLRSLTISQKQIENLCIVYDDLDLPFEKTKLSFNKSSGGHRGLESIIKTLKTEKFYRIRVGISPKTPSGKIKKPKGEDAVNKLIMKDFNDDEIKKLKKLSKDIDTSIKLLIEDGYEKSASFLN